MLSPAYEEWAAYVADARALRNIGDTGCRRVGESCLPLSSAETETLCRAALVALSAAFERYVVGLFGLAASETGRSGLWAQERLLDPTGDDRRFANPSARNVRQLFGLLFHGQDVWAGIATPMRSEDMVQEYVDEHQQYRHDVAHGRDSPRFSTADIRERIHEFERIVQALDASVGGLVRHATGKCTWSPP